MASSGNLELLESRFLSEFANINITSIVEYDKNIIIGDSTGRIGAYKQEGKKLVNYYNNQLKSKIDKLIAVSDLNILYVLSGGNLLLYDLPTFVDKSPKDSDKESKDFKDIANIYENKDPQNKGDLMIITKKKKVLLFYYKQEMLRLVNKNLLDKDKNQISINLLDIPEKLIWYGNNICYYIKSGKLIIISIKEKDGIVELVETKEDLPVENIAHIQSLWFVLVQGGCGMFFESSGGGAEKNMISFNPEISMIDLEVFNDLYIVALNTKTIDIYDINDSNPVQELNIENDTQGFTKKFLSKGNNRIFVISSNKKDEKDKNFIYNLWEIRELSFERQIKLSLKSNQIEKAYNILNSKLDYNMLKFDFLKSFYNDCAWNSIYKKTKEGYEEAENYFGLCNFNPFELIYHFITLLKIKPIHTGFDDISKIPEVANCQINSKEGNLDANVISALQMLINTLQVKKNYLLKTNGLLNTEVQKGKVNIVSFESVKNNPLSFESSQNCFINLKEIEPKNIKLFETIKMINEVLIKAMVLLKIDISSIKEIIEKDQCKIDCEEFLSNLNTFTSNIALACIYKKNKKFSDSLKTLEQYINKNDSSNEKENKEAVKLLKSMLISFGKIKDYIEPYEQGLKMLLKNHYMDAFEVLLTNELISIDNFLEKFLPDEPENINKREVLLKMLCEEEKYSAYSNEKYQTMYLNLLLNDLFTKLKKDEIPKNKESEKFPEEYKKLKDLCEKYQNYNKTQLLEKVKDSWMYDIELYLLSKLIKNDEAIKKLIGLVKTNHKEFEDIREYCKTNYNNDTDIFKKYFKNLREKYDDKAYEEMKPIFKKEMLKLIDLFISGELLDPEVSKNKNKLELLNILNPKEILTLLPSEWKLNESLDGKDKNKTIFNLMHFYLKEYAIINNNYKRLENLAKMDLTYKQKKLYDLRDKHILLDSNSSCYLCGKKITNNTQFLVYPNGHIYHSKCSPDLHLEIKTGKNFQNFDY